MKTASSAILLLALFLACNAPHEWSVDELVGHYRLQPEEQPLTEKLFTSDNVSGWDYDSPCNFALELNADSTYEQSCNGGGFESPRYRGTWRISNDSVYLQPLYEVLGWEATEQITTLSAATVEVLVIQPDSTMQVVFMASADTGRTIVRE
jgi:hypothetical protein